jgi:hypothetical protein
MSEAAAPSYTQLYNEAFDRYGVRALWSCRRLENPTPSQALAVARMLRRQGDLAALRLAEQIEDACRAAV